MPGAELLGYVSGKRLAAGEAGRGLRQGGAGGVEAAQGQDVDFAEQVSHGTRRQLLFQLFVGLPGGVSAGAMLESIGPLVVGCAVAAVGEGREIGRASCRERV